MNYGLPSNMYTKTKAFDQNLFFSKSEAAIHYNSHYHRQRSFPHWILGQNFGIGIIFGSVFTSSDGIYFFIFIAVTVSGAEPSHKISQRPTHRAHTIFYVSMTVLTIIVLDALVPLFVEEIKTLAVEMVSKLCIIGGSYNVSHVRTSWFVGLGE